MGFVIRDPFAEFNGVDLSDQVRQVEVNMSQADVDETASGDDGQERLAGLRNDSFVFTFKQDLAAGEVDATLFPLFDNGTKFEVRVAARGSTISDTNPAYAGDVIITDYSPLSGEIGALAEAQVTLPVSGKIARETT